VLKEFKVLLAQLVVMEQQELLDLKVQKAMHSP